MSETQSPITDHRHPRQRITILDTEMSYVDVGVGDPIVFYMAIRPPPISGAILFRISPLMVVASPPDLVGFGQSGKSPKSTYGFLDHVRYLDAWFDALGLTKNITLVLHDWGSALGFYRAYRHPGQIRAIAYMEALVQPRSWEDFSHGRDAIFRALRSESGEQMVLHDNFFVETVLPKSILRTLSEQEMAAYREPFTSTWGARLPTLIWSRELPIEGAPAEVTEIVERYGQWLSQSSIPKLLISADPGALLSGRALEFCRCWPNQQEVSVKGIHYLQEDSPHEIGIALQAFVRQLAAQRNALPSAIL